MRKIRRQETDRILLFAFVNQEIMINYILRLGSGRILMIEKKRCFLICLGNNLTREICCYKIQLILTFKNLNLKNLSRHWHSEYLIYEESLTLVVVSQLESQIKSLCPHLEFRQRHNTRHHDEKVLFVFKLLALLFFSMRVSREITREDVQNMF